MFTNRSSRSPKSQSVGPRTRLAGARTRRKTPPRGFVVEPLEDRLLLATVPIVNEFQELHAADLAKGDLFGKSVDFSANIAVVGAYKDDDSGRNSGSAYIFQRNDNETSLDPTDDVWTQVDKLIADDSSRNDEFGISVAIDGNDASGYTVAILGGGAVYVFQSQVNDAGTPEDPDDDYFDWPQRTRLTPADGGAFVGGGTGGAVSISDATIVVGSPLDDGSGADAGAIFVFRDASAAGNWSETSPTKLLGTDTAKGDHLGSGVSISGNTIVAAAEPAAYVFENTGGTWQQAAKLTRIDGADLGRVVAISESGDTIVASSVWRTFVYTRPETGWDDATEEARLLPWDWHDANPGTEDSFRFGFALDISEDTIVVGAPSRPGGGAAYVFDNDTWQPRALLLSGDDAEGDSGIDGNLGIGVATDGGTIMGGDSNDDAEETELGPAVDAGSVYVFPRDVVAQTGITVLPASGLVTTEAGGADTFTVVLNTQPTADVTIDLNSSDTSEGTVSPGSLTFTANNWDTAQSVQVTGTDDVLADGDIVYTIATAAAVSGDADYDGLDPDDVLVTNEDDDGSHNDTNALYVYDIRFESKRGGKDWRAVFEIRNDSNADGLPGSDDSVRAGVTVTVNFAGQTFTGVTDANGVMSTSWLRNLGSGSHYANAVDLVLAGYFWDPLDVDDEDDTDGDGKPDDLLVI